MWRGGCRLNISVAASFAWHSLQGVPFRNAAIDGYDPPLWVNFCRVISQKAPLLYPTKLPRRTFAIEAVTGQ
jgi:hypothetical protein